MKPRTSDTHPLQIVFVETPGHGRIGMTFCPGKHDPRAKTGPWSRDMHTDIAAIADWGADALITLMESHELDLLGVSGRGMQFWRRGWAGITCRFRMCPSPTSRSKCNGQM